jgi:hypothetical protein
MATIKSYTDLQQSKKLAEILPLESADMHYGSYSSNFVDYPIPNSEDDCKCGYKGLPCWSLASLLGVLDYPQLSKDKLGSGKVGWMVSVYPNDCRYNSCWHDNPIDACVDIIEKLNELNLL